MMCLDRRRIGTAQCVSKKTTTLFRLNKFAIINSTMDFCPPITPTKTSFSITFIHQVVKKKPVMLANYGYFGHM